MNLTTEQQYVIDTVLSNKDQRIVAINSVAGSGKSSTAKALVEAYKPKNGFLFAFNKAIIEDTKKKMNGMINCSTIHSLAYKYVRPTEKIKKLNYDTIIEPISYDDKATIINILDNFFRSSSVDVEEYALTKCTNPELVELVVQYANKMLDGKIPPTFNYMLKCLHLMLLHKEVEIDFDLFILDECQDTTAVALEIFKLINAKNKVMFGDKYQNIYSFMNTVNAFEELKDLNLLKLTKSFRCSPDIAEEVRQYGNSYLEESFKFEGNDKIVKTDDLSMAYITRTNSALIERMYSLLNTGYSFSLTRDVKEIFALPIALLNASKGRPVYDTDYKFLEKEYKLFLPVARSYRNFFEYIIQVTEDPVLESTSKVLANFANKRINIYDIKEKVTNMKPNKAIVLTTAHAFKGLERNVVYIEDDLNNSVNRVIDRLEAMKHSDYPITQKELKDTLSKEQKEDLNTYYVALSRAKTSLLNKDYH